MIRIASLLFIPSALAAQWRPAPAFQLPTSPLAISQRAQPQLPFTVAGERGAIFGRQDGSFEVWDFPTKIASHFALTAELAGYPIPIELNEYASEIEVNPERTTITYSHAAFTVKQHMFAARKGASAAGAVTFLEISSIRPLALTIRFTPDMLRMWPAANFGRPSAEWVPAGQSGYYLLHTDNDKFYGAIGMPGAKPGVMAPYQERPRTYPLELKLAFDPKTQSGLFFPLLVAASGRELLARSESWPAAYRATAGYYEHFFDRRLTTRTPEPRFDLAIRWAELAIDQAQVTFHGETGLVAGYYSSADSARPGFGWFFGRDTLFTLFAVHSYGDFDLSRRALEFLLRRQRPDGKIMHEFSQAADLVDWKATPYFYAAADSTPLLVITIYDYVRSSANTQFLSTHWDAVKKAWAFTRAHDSDGDGIYENTEGTGWVESWPPAMPHQEIYLAALDQQSCEAMSRLALLMHDGALAKQAEDQAALIRSKLFSEYFDPARKFYAFSRNFDGSTDHTATVFPAIAWWAGTLSLPQSDVMMSRWASHEFSTDWGLRDIGANEPIYDPLSYHQGSVWPLYTGWTSLAEYRAGQPLSGFAHLMQNTNQTFTQDSGAVTELLSGEYFQPFGRSSSHQMWSSAMVLTPAVRGLFGVEPDALRHALRIRPQLPASWNSAGLQNVMLGDLAFQLKFERKQGKLMIEAVAKEKQLFCIESDAPCSPDLGASQHLEIDLPGVEIELPHELPVSGSATRQCKVISQKAEGRSITFEFEGQGGETVEMFLRLNHRNNRVDGAAISRDKLAVTFPQGAGYQRQTVRFDW
ncbi:MAG: glycogen debranching protein [Acidobacteriota bacterium]|nr:glycogen debranching protein [Acidobacteriota bacterium]